jgi:Cu+-exporting ATPase
MNPDHVHDTHAAAPQLLAIPPEALKDPVCGMTVTAASPHVLQHAGRRV